MRFSRAAWLIALMSTVAASGAHASSMLITDPTGYTGPQLNLSGFANGNYNFTFGPVSLPNGITFTANPGGGGNSGLGSAIGQGVYGLGGNGSFGGDATYIGVDSTTGFDTLTFANAVSSFGGFFNYFTPQLGNPATITALD